jgi:hypothetical protein
MSDLNVPDVEIGYGRHGLILDGANKIKSIKKRIALYRAKCENANCYSPSERYEERKTFLKIKEGTCR